MWFTSVITLWFVEIPSSIDNARQTIAKISITEDGTDSATLEMEISSWGIYINTWILQEQYNFLGNVLWIDDNGNLVYVSSDSLVVSWAGGGVWGWDGLWTGGNDIYPIGTGKVGIGIVPTSGKVHIKGISETELYLQENTAGSWANINFKNTVNTRMMWWVSNRFYLWLDNVAFINIDTGGKVAIGPMFATVPLQVSGSIIWGKTNNTITNSPDGSILWGSENSLSGGENFSILAGEGNRIISKDSSGRSLNNSILWWQWNSIYTNGKWQWHDHIVWWQWNSISGEVSYSSIWWGNSNKMYSSYSFIWWWERNKIGPESNYSVIVWWRWNSISWAQYSFAGGVNAKVNNSYSFVWNTDDLTSVSTIKEKTFIVNAINGIWIRTNNPQGDLHVAGSGVVVFEPQINNPQWIGSGCITTGSVIYTQTNNVLCFCNGTWRKLVEDSTKNCIL
jgi:hypothetical protein